MTTSMLKAANTMASSFAFRDCSKANIQLRRQAGLSK